MIRPSFFLGESVSGVLVTVFRYCVFAPVPTIMASSSRSFSGEPDETLKHFYVYDECHLPIIVSATYTPLDQQTPKSQDVAVDPGHQTMILTTYKASISTKSVSKDGKLSWSMQQFSLSDSEYTHVIACRCPPKDGTCEEAEQWPQAKSRQFPATGKPQASHK